MNLKIELRTIYGRKMYYPGCDKSTKLLKLTKQKSFTEQDIKTLKSLGYVIENVTKQDEI
jgi:hypothetical protein